MYNPNSFKLTDRAVLDAFVREHSFATVINQGGDALDASHLPLLLDADRGAHGVLSGHMARANPQWQSLSEGETLAVFSGPHAYVSPRYYGGGFAVPTWNYAVVHAYGRGQLLDAEALQVSLGRLVEEHEQAGWEPAWNDPR